MGRQVNLRAFYNATMSACNAAMHACNVSLPIDKRTMRTSHAALQVNNGAMEVNNVIMQACIVTMQACNATMEVCNAAFRTGEEISVVFRPAKAAFFRGAKGDIPTVIDSPVLSSRRYGGLRPNTGRRAGDR